MITKLTPEQEAMMPRYVERWTAIGRCTDRINPATARTAVRDIYLNADKEPPKEILFVDSPKAGYELFKQLGGKSKDNFFSGIFYGNNESHWLAFYQFFRDEVGMSGLDKIVPLIRAAEECGWIYCGKDVAIVMDRPCTIKLDEEGRTHCEDGPAISHIDGFSVYMWHGVRVPGMWITNKASLTAKMALAVSNVERRRAACEILGWNTIIAELDGVTIDEDEDPMIGTLLRVNIPDIGTEQFLRVRCGTGREFAIPVPPDVRTALEANAWSYDIPLDVFGHGPEVRT